MARSVTNLLLEYVDEGIIDKDHLIESCLNYMSEDDVIDMALTNELISDYHLQNDEDFEQQFSDLDENDRILQKHGYGG